MFTFLYVKANSKEICEESLCPSFFRKMLMSAFLLRFEANLLFLHGANLVHKPPYLVGTVLKRIIVCPFFKVREIKFFEDCMFFKLA